jgi:hypothetical protein
MQSVRVSNSSVARLASALFLYLVATGANFTPNTDVSPPPTGDSTLVVTASVTPTSAPIGQPFDFHVTVTNTGTETKRFYVDGCPVLYMIDQIYSPVIACPAVVREVILEPGQDITFGPENDAVLHFDPHQYPIGPGEHSAELTVTGLWLRASVSFHVQAPTTDLAYAAGRVTRADGSVLHDFIAELVSPNANSAAYHVPVTPEGYFFFENVAPGTYLLRVGNDAEVWWYPGVQGPDLAKPITLSAGQYQGGLEMVIPGGIIPGAEQTASTPHRSPTPSSSHSLSKARRPMIRPASCPAIRAVSAGAVLDTRVRTDVLLRSPTRTACSPSTCFRVRIVSWPANLARIDISISIMCTPSPKPRNIRGRAV